MRVSKNILSFTAISLLVAYLIWRILLVGFSEFYATHDTPDFAASALAWRATQPVALYQQGQAKSGLDSESAESLLQESIWADPTNALAYLALADLWAGSGRLPEATGLVEIAEVLGPMRTPALARTAAFWFKQGHPDRALERWSALIQSNPVTAAQVFPSLLQLADNPATRVLLLPLLESPPAWWNRFFAYAAANARQTETVIFLYQRLHRSGTLPSTIEQQAYLNRLFKASLWQDAYLAWLGGLDGKAQTGLGSIYNGGFELPISGIGFDWHATPLRRVRVETMETYGTHGTRSLFVSLDGLRERYRHFQQTLFLEPGLYRFQGRARPAGLMPRQGLRWSLYCVNPKEPPLAATETFCGKEDWQNFVLDFELPKANCPIQILRLEQEAQVIATGEAKGSVWFDDLAIDRR